jgi:branched-chain amino acid transport system substrate-binding protein
MILFTDQQALVSGRERTMQMITALPFQRTITTVFFSFSVLILTGFLSSCQESPQLFDCIDALGCVTIAPEEPLRIGVLQALSGPVAPLGHAQIKGLELAIDKRNDTLLGHPIVTQIEDTGCTAEGGANAVLKLIANPQTTAIFGSTCSGAAATASRAMSAAGLTMISGNNSAPFLTSIASKAAPDFQKGYFRTAPNEENAGKAAAEYVYQELGLKRAATIHDNDIYTRGLVESFQKSFLEMGGEVVLATAINKGDSMMEPVLHAVGKSTAQLLFFPLFQPEGNHILQQTKNLSSLDGILLISGGALIEQSFIKAMGEAGKGMYFVGPQRPSGTGVAHLTETYQKKYNENPSVSYFLSAFDAADLLFHALESVAIQEKDGTLHIGRQALRNFLYDTSAHPGVTGLLSCDQFGDCGNGAFNILRLDVPELGLEGLESNIVHAWVQSE